MTLPPKSKHINFQFKSEELDQHSVCRKFRRTTQTKKSSAQLSARENFFLKNTTSGKRLILNPSRLLYVSTLPLNTPIFGTKAL